MHSGVHVDNFDTRLNYLITSINWYIDQFSCTNRVHEFWKILSISVGNEEEIHSVSRDSELNWIQNVDEMMWIFTCTIDFLGFTEVGVARFVHTGHLLPPPPKKTNNPRQHLDPQSPPNSKTLKSIPYPSPPLNPSRNTVTTFIHSHNPFSKHQNYMSPKPLLLRNPMHHQASRFDAVQSQSSSIETHVECKWVPSMHLCSSTP